MPTSPQAECFGPGSGGSGQGRTRAGGERPRHRRRGCEEPPSLNPLLLTDTFVSQGFGLGVCAIGGQVAQGSAFWYTKVNHAGAAGGWLAFEIHSGDQASWYLSPNFPRRLSWC